MAEEKKAKPDKATEGKPEEKAPESVGTGTGGGEEPEDGNDS